MPEKLYKIGDEILNQNPKNWGRKSLPINIESSHFERHGEVIKHYGRRRFCGAVVIVHYKSLPLHEMIPLVPTQYHSKVG